ncbi:TetR/AcrR family transcriptional regulator [Nocardioides pacificus]
MTPAHRRPPGRPREDDADDRIMDAALLEYAEHGRAGFTLNGCARRSGVGKSSIYRRWPDKDALLAAAVNARSRALEDVDTGTLRTDLEALAANLLRYWLDPAGWVTIRIAVDAVGGEQPTAPFYDEISRNHRLAANRIVERAMDRGELPADVSVSLVVQAVYGILLMQVLTLRHPGTVLSEAEVTAQVGPVVEFVLARLGDTA